MIPVFNTRKIRDQLGHQRKAAQKRGQIARSRAAILALIKNVKPIHFEPDPAPIMDEWGFPAMWGQRQQSPIPAEPSTVKPIRPVGDYRSVARGVGECYEIPHDLAVYHHELANSRGLEPWVNLNNALFDAKVTSYSNRTRSAEGGQAHRAVVLRGLTNAAGGAWDDPWRGFAKLLQGVPISDEDWAKILNLGREMYGLVDGEAWHPSISLWSERYFLTPYEAGQFRDILVPCESWNPYDDEFSHLDVVRYGEHGWPGDFDPQYSVLPQYLQGSSNRTPRSLKRRILKDAEKIFRRKYASKCGDLSPHRSNPLYTGRGGMCPYWALAVVKAAAKHGKRLVLQAGSMQWRIVPPELDDGVSANAFAYMWSPNEPASRRAIAMGALPEVHVWAADPATQEIIDLSTRDFKRIAENQFGLEWATKPPPPYLWVNQEEYMAMPDPTYRADPQATMFVLGLLRRKGLL
jgi:hypothetical protein